MTQTMVHSKQMTINEINDNNYKFDIADNKCEIKNDIDHKQMIIIMR